MSRYCLNPVARVVSHRDSLIRGVRELGLFQIVQPREENLS